MTSKLRVLVLLAGVLLTLAMLGTALAEPPTPTKPTVPPTPPTGAWDSMREWMDSQWGKGFTDRMHGSWEGMVESCNTMMSSNNMMGTGNMMGGGGMMGPGSRPGNAARYGGMMGANQTPGGSWGGMMTNFMGGVRARFLLPWF